MSNEPLAQARAAIVAEWRRMSTLPSTTALVGERVGRGALAIIDGVEWEG